MDFATPPTRFPIPFASAAVAPYVHEVPEASQVGITTGAASLTDGFPPANFSPVSAGGVPPFGNDMNGILKQATEWIRWFTAGGPAPYDSSFATSISGYPKGAIIPGTIPGSAWISTADANTSDPNAGGADWSPYGPSTGDAKLTLKTTADYGWVMANDGTVGNGSSNATTYADALAEALFTLVWTNVNNTYAPLLTSAGAPVARGLTAAADFAANRAITLPKVLGRALAVAGAGSGLTSHVLGQTLGAETVTISQANLPSYTLPNTLGISKTGLSVSTDSSKTSNLSGGADGVNTTFGNTPTISITGGVQSGGSGTAVDVEQPTSFWNFMIKL